MKNLYYKSVMKLLPLWVACTFWCLGTQVSAQITPVGEKFHGEWSFDHAQAQERPMNSQDPFTPRTVTQNDLQNYNYFYGAPIEITFMADGTAHMVSLASAQNATVTITDNNVLEFIQQTTDEEGNNVTAVTATFYNLTLSGNTMTLQYHYFYGTGEEPGRTYTDGILTIYYSK